MSFDSLPSRLIQVYAFLGLIILIGASGATTLFGSYGIEPGYDLIGGLLSYTFIHDGPDHLWGNVAILAPTMGMFALIERIPLLIMAVIIAVSGVIIWLIEIGTGFGSSALYCALIPYVVIRGFLSMKLLGIALACAMLFFFGRELAMNVLPSLYGSINYGHIGGAIGGAVVAVAMSLMRVRTA